MYGPPKYGQAFTWVFAMDATGQSPAVTLSQDGGSFAALTGAPGVNEIDATMWYKVVVPASDTEWGTGLLRATAGGATTVEERMYIDRTAQVAHARFGNAITNRPADGAWDVCHDDNETEQRTFTLSESDGEITATPSNPV